MIVDIRSILTSIRKYGFVLAVLAIHVLSIGGLVYTNQAPALAQQAVAVPPESAFKQATISGYPVRIELPNAGISLEIAPGSYSVESNDWTLGGERAFFADITRQPNNGSGNTFIYGHNNNKVFGHIKKINTGDEAIVTTDNGNKFYYTLTGSKVTQPEDVSIFSYTGSPILTVQTCTGVWHEQRELYTFSLDRIEESAQSAESRTEQQRIDLLKQIATVSDIDFALSESKESTIDPAVQVTSPQQEAAVEDSVVQPFSNETVEQAFKPSTLLGIKAKSVLQTL